MSGDEVKWLILTEKGKELGPFKTVGVFNLIKSGQLSGFEQIKKFPNGEWIQITKKAQFYDELISALERGPRPAQDKTFDETIVQARDPLQKNVPDEEIEKTQVISNIQSDKKSPQSTSLKEALERIKNLNNASSSLPEHVDATPKTIETPTPETQETSLTADQVRQISAGNKLRKSLSLGLVFAGTICVLALFFAYEGNKDQNKSHLTQVTDSDGTIKLLSPQQKGEKITTETYSKIYRTASEKFLKSSVEELLESQKLLISLIEAQIEVRPQSTYARGLLCLLHYELWPYAKSSVTNQEVVIATALAAIDEDRSSKDALYCETVKLLVEGRTLDAKGLLEASMNKPENSNDPILFFLRGHVLLTNLDFNAAKNYLNEAKEGLKNWPKAHLDSARVNAILGDFIGVKEGLTSALKLNHTYKSAQLSYGSYLNEIEKNPMAAQATLNQALNNKGRAENADIARSAFNLALILSIKDKVKAKEFAQMSFDHAPTVERYKNLLMQLGGDGLLSPLAQKNLDLMSSADALRIRGDCFQAQAEYKAIYTKYPANSQAAYYAGLCLSQLSKTESAVFWMSEAIKADAKNARAYQKRADYQAQLFDFEEALKGLQQGFRLMPNHFELLKGLGVVEFRRNNFVMAVDYFQKAIAKNPLDVETLSLLSKSYLKISENSKAKEFAERARNLDPLSPLAQEAYSKMLVKVENFSAASAHLKRTIEKYSYNPKFRFILAELNFENDRFSEASSLVFQLTEAEPKNKEVWLLSGDAFWAQAKFKEAIESYSRAALLDANDGRAVFRIGKVYLETGRTKNAIEQFKLAEMINSKLPKLYLSLGLASMQDEKHKVALSYFEKEKKINPGIADSYEYTAEIYAMNKDYQKCIDEFQLIIPLKRPGAKTYVRLARCQRLAGNIDAAQDTLELAFQEESGYAETYKEQGAIFESRGENLSAAEAYNRYIVLTPNAADRAEVEKRILSIGGKLNGNN